MVSLTLVRFVLVLACLVAFGPSLGEARRKKLKFCKLDNLLECFNEPIAFFTSQENGTGIASNEVEFEQYCFNNHDYLPYCVTKWIKRCGSEMHVEIARRIFVLPMQESMRAFCDSKGTIRPKFLEHSKCLIEQVKLHPDYRRQCVRPMQANNEYIHSLQSSSANVTAFFRGFCCAYNQWEDCIVGFLRRNCGEEATKSIPHLIHHTTMDLLKGLCPHTKYEPTDEAQCPPALFRAPEDYKPTGYGSKSLISHMFSVLCPNIGWGLLPHRDF